MKQYKKDDTATSNTSPTKNLKQPHSTADTTGLDDNNQSAATTRSWAANRNWYNEL